MNTNEPHQQLKSKAKLAYETGRLKLIMNPALCLVAFILITLYALGSISSTHLLEGSMLLTAAAWMLWRGETYGRSAQPALLAGIMPLTFPLMFHGTGPCCGSGDCSSWCLAACVAGGLLAGLTLGFMATKDKNKPLYLALGTMVVIAEGQLGCGMIGASGVLGMIAAIIFTSVPVLLFAPRWQK